MAIQNKMEKTTLDGRFKAVQYNTKTIITGLHHCLPYFVVPVSLGVKRATGTGFIQGSLSKIQGLFKDF